MYAYMYVLVFVDLQGRYCLRHILTSSKGMEMEELGVHMRVLLLYLFIYFIEKLSH